MERLPFQPYINNDDDRTYSNFNNLQNFFFDKNKNPIEYNTGRTRLQKYNSILFTKGLDTQDRVKNSIFGPNLLNFKGYIFDKNKCTRISTALNQGRFQTPTLYFFIGRKYRPSFFLYSLSL